MKNKFKLHDYPYHYKCEKCGYKFDLTEEQEDSWKDGYELFDDDPLSFECEKCKHVPVKPVGYVTPPNFENFVVFLPPSEEDIKLYDELFGPLGPND